MDSKTRRFLCAAVVFCLLFAAVFFPVQEIFARKSLLQPWDMTRKVAGFYNEPEDSFSVMYFGSSHAYASFSPLAIWQETGVTGYVFATQLQPMWASVTYLKEALKTQTPQLIVLECNMLYENAAFMDAGVNHSFADDLPLSRNKIALSRVAAGEGERFPLVFNFMRYHARWNELSAADFTFRRSEVRDPYKGFVILPTQTGGADIEQPALDDAAAALPISEKNEAYLREFIEICQKNGIDLWLTKAPSNISPEHMQVMHTAEKIAAEYKLPFDNFNGTAAYEAIGLTTDDFFDARHMDITGGTRFSSYFARLLTERYPDLPKDPENSVFAADYETYRAAAAQAADRD